MLKDEITCRSCNTLLSIPFENELNDYVCPDCNTGIKTQIKNKHPRVEFEMLTTKILCIDFGTSSIRASIRDDDGPPIALDIGESSNSSIDKASIPSAIFISTSGDEILFGEDALSRGLKGIENHIFEISPKKWIALDHLQEFIFDKSGITKSHLLSGLLNHSLLSICKCLRLSIIDLKSYEIRVSHPVWNHKNKAEVMLKFEKIISDAFLIGDSSIKVFSNNSLFSKISGHPSMTIYTSVDTIEPIGAALELFNNSENSREFCVLIDVGAGTTDMASFISLTPDVYRIKRKLIRISEPISIYKAGDLIDNEVIKLIKNKSKSDDRISLKLLSLRRRQIKEVLFKNSKIFEANTEVTLSELNDSFEIQNMCSDVRQSFEALIEESAPHILPYITASNHRVDEVKVIFSGGGSKIKFLQDAIGRCIHIAGKRLPISIVENTSPPPNLPASHERLAVALGGTTPEDDWPITEFEEPSSTSHRAYFL